MPSPSKSNNGRKRTAAPQRGRTSSGSIDWSIYLQKGVIAELQIKRYRGTTTIDFTELGIDEDSSAEFKSFMSSYMTPGQKRLIPPEIEGQLKSIETTARQNLKECSFPCTAFDAQGKFIPASSYRKFKIANEELKDRFFEIRDEFASNYDNIISRIKKDYGVLAKHLYMQSHPGARQVPSRYVTSFVDKIISQIPSKDIIVGTFEYNTILRPIPPYLLNVIRKKRDIDERVMSIAAAGTLDKEPAINVTPAPDVVERDTYIIEPIDDAGDDDGIEFVGDGAGDGASDIVRSVTESNDRFMRSKTAKRKMALTASQNSVSVEDEISSDVQRSLNEQSRAMATGFIIDIMTKIRNMAYDGSCVIINSIEKNNGKLVGRTSMKAHSLIDDLKRMDYGDKALQAYVRKLETSLSDVNGKPRDVEAVKSAAIEMRDWAERSLDDIAKLHYAGAPQPPVKERGSATSQKQQKKSDDTKISVPASRRRRGIKKRL